MCLCVFISNFYFGSILFWLNSILAQFYFGSILFWLNSILAQLILIGLNDVSIFISLAKPEKPYSINVGNKKSRTGIHRQANHMYHSLPMDRCFHRIL